MLVQVFELMPMIIREAERGVQEYHLSYSGTQVWAAARLNQVITIFSEDFNTGQMLEGVRFANPFAADFRLEAWI